MIQINYLIEIANNMLNFTDNKELKIRIRVSITRISMMPRKLPNLNLDHSFIDNNHLISINSLNEVTIIIPLNDIIYE